MNVFEMEPMLPEACRELTDKAVDLIAQSSALLGMLNADVKLAVADLVRTMDCHYSNRIADADCLQDSTQKTTSAHIKAQFLIDSGEAPEKPLSKAFISWVHRELYHCPPEYGALDPLLDHFEQVYDPALHSRDRQVIAVAAAHHRLIWIHPFNDSNGLLARLMSHACLTQLGLDSRLWSLSRGLAQNPAKYKRLLQAAGKPHLNSLNGHSTLSQRSLARFCDYFLDSCIHQVNDMHRSLQPQGLQLRIERYCAFETDARRLLPGSWNLLREALLCGAFNRGRAAALTGKGSVQARKVLARLIEKGLLVSDTPKSAVRLGLPLYALDQWLPGLYQ